jgi:glycogen debranching enzyme
VSVAPATQRDAGERDAGSRGPDELALTSAGALDKLVRARSALFLVTDQSGDIAPAGARELGLFHADTRHLSHYALSVASMSPSGAIAGATLVRLSGEDTGEAFSQIDLMLSGDPGCEGNLDDPQNYLHVRRRQALDDALHEEITLTNFLAHGARVKVELAYGADFADIFEVRGAHRACRGTSRPYQVGKARVLFRYDGLAGTRYATTIAFSTVPTTLDGRRASFDFELAPGAEATLIVTVTPRAVENDDMAPRPSGKSFARRVRELDDDAARLVERSASFKTDDARLQRVLDRSLKDLHALRIVVPGDPVRAILGAGIPWFAAPFGRDALIASYEALVVDPDLAIESLRTLAAYQGSKFDDDTEEEPGKIFHELRFGEMVRAREIPHSPYYGSIDATPLFLVTLDATYHTTGDRELLRDLLPAALRALAWLDEKSEYGTRAVTYAKRGPRGLDNQGWKDSRAGVSFPDGRRAAPPIALVEVQGYVADAYLRGARILSAVGDHERARTYAARAAEMRILVQKDWWLPDLSRFAFAFDGAGRALTTDVSNVGHLLWSRVPTEEQAALTAQGLLGPAMFSGYGVRTLAAGQPVYNPLSYHNGTVWPHDNAILARGLSNYGLVRGALQVFDGLHAALGYFGDDRVPELYCGIPRRAGPLVRYPVACSPQAWSAASPFLCLKAILGLDLDAPRGRLAIKRPHLPKSMRTLDIKGLRVGAARVSIRFRRVGERCHVDRLDVTGAPLRTEIELD